MFFMRIKMLPFLFLFAYICFVLFLRVKFPCKKNWGLKLPWWPHWHYYLCAPLKPSIKNLFVRIYLYLWEPFFSWSFVKIFFFINLLQYFAIISKPKLKILILLQKSNHIYLFFICAYLFSSSYPLKFILICMHIAYKNLLEHK